jgi:hypothetical protein
LYLPAICQRENAVVQRKKSPKLNKFSKNQLPNWVPWLLINFFFSLL